MAALAITSSMACPIPSPLHYWSANSSTNSRRRKISSFTYLRIQASSLADASALLKAAHHTVDKYIKSALVVGLESGQASAMAIEYLGRHLRAGSFRDIVGIPINTRKNKPLVIANCVECPCFCEEEKTSASLLFFGLSVESAGEPATAGMPLDYYQDNSQIDVAFDDADVIEEGTLTAIIGRRSLQSDESLIQEKLNWLETAEEIDDLFLGDAEVWRRPAIGHAGPLGGDFHLVTREGHNVLDVIFTSPIVSLDEVAKGLDKIDGVVDHRIISKFPCTAVIASESGLSIVDNLSKNSVEGL